MEKFVRLFVFGGHARWLITSTAESGGGVELTQRKRGGFRFIRDPHFLALKAARFQRRCFHRIQYACPFNTRKNPLYAQQQ